MEYNSGDSPYRIDVPVYDVYVHVIGTTLDVEDIRWFDEAISRLDTEVHRFAVYVAGDFKTQFVKVEDCYANIKAIHRSLERENYPWRIRRVDLYDASLSSLYYVFNEISENIYHKTCRGVALHFEKFGIMDL